MKMKANLKAVHDVLERHRAAIVTSKGGSAASDAVVADLAALSCLPRDSEGPSERDRVRGHWQPIETAPKDGTPVRLFDPEHCDEEMNPSLEGDWSDGAHDDAGGFQAAVWNNAQDYFATVDVNPTHWMPLSCPSCGRAASRNPPAPPSRARRSRLMGAFARLDPDPASTRVTMPDWPRLMGVELAAAYLGIGASTLRESGPQPKRHGRRVLYDRRDLDRWADALDGQPLDAPDRAAEADDALRRIEERMKHGKA